MRLNRLLPGLTLVGSLLLALPTEAARLQFWRFDPQANRLTFTTDDSIRPTAQLLSNPTRLVVDLPGTTLSRPEVQRINDEIRTISVSELDEETTRLVIEYEPGYTVDPSQVQVRGESDRQWTIDLPDAISRENPSRPIADSTGSNQVASNSEQAGETTLESVFATADGFFVRTSGETPDIDVDRFREDGQQFIEITLDDAAIAPTLTAERLPNNRYSVEQWSITQSVEDDTSTTQIVLSLGEGSPDWNISASASGLVLLPRGVSISQIPDAAPISSQPAVEPESTPASPRPTVIDEPVAATPRQTEPPALPQLPQGRFTVALDPGHGGRDPGAVGINGLQEKVVVNDITPQVAQILREQGVNVVLTRDRDFELDLAPRVQIAEQANATIFVSIHANAISMSRPDVNGLETFYSSEAGRRLATTVHNVVLNEMGMRDRRVRSARFYVIRRTSMPAILIETGFVTGAEDAPNLADPAWRERMARAIARGILLHLQQGV